MPIDQSYLEEIKKRKKNSKVYKEFQLVGLEIAELLGDAAHKSLYIKLAKTAGKSLLMAVAKDVSTRKGIKNKGAYFMKVWKEEKNGKKKKVGIKASPGSELY